MLCCRWQHVGQGLDQARVGLQRVQRATKRQQRLRQQRQARTAGASEQQRVAQLQQRQAKPVCVWWGASECWDDLSVEATQHPATPPRAREPATTHRPCAHAHLVPRLSAASCSSRGLQAVTQSSALGAGGRRLVAPPPLLPGLAAALSVWLAAASSSLGIGVVVCGWVAGCRAAACCTEAVHSQ